MPRLPEAEEVPPSSFSEPSEPSDLCPGDKPASTLRGPQEENPQLIAHSKGRQSGDAEGTNAGSRASRGAGGAGGGGRGNASTGGGTTARQRADEEKRNDVAGGFGVGRSKL
ncbi:hypothetical protein C8Q74DRAFT_1366762 [Fomes fomentarius]|nr:hypothetical protein C8Q74DRAFT_1366762 [Fomes fomentarius]